VYLDHFAWVSHVSELDEPKRRRLILPIGQQLPCAIGCVLGTEIGGKVSGALVGAILERIPMHLDCSACWWFAWLPKLDEGKTWLQSDFSNL
jgi:hypothetical protein